MFSFLYPLTLQTLGDYIASILIDESESLDSRFDVIESILLGSSENVCLYSEKLKLGYFLFHGAIESIYNTRNEK